jgi:hypothetical protein
MYGLEWEEFLTSDESYRDASMGMRRRVQSVKLACGSISFVPMGHRA